MKQDNIDRARLAVRNFQRMTSVLSAYATEVRGTPVKVKAGKSTYTDNKDIYIRPPLALADKLKHVDCGLRDDNDLLVCPACALRQNIRVMLHHEIAHLMHGSFEEYATGDFSKVATYTRRLMPYISTHTWSASGKMDTLTWSHKVDPMIAMLNMGVEDHRINEASYDLRPALRLAHNQMSEDILHNGIEQEQGDPIMWGDRKPDEQAMIATLFTMQGMELRGYLDDEVVDIVETIEFKRAIRGNQDMRDAMSALRMSVKLLAFWRERGYFEHKDPYSMTEEERESYEEFLKALREILKNLYGHDDTSHGHAADTDTTKGGTVDDEEAEQALSQVAKNSDHLDSTVVNIPDLNFYPRGKGKYSMASGNPYVVRMPDEALIGKTVAKARAVLQANARVERHNNQKKGRISARALGKRAWNDSDMRMFQHKVKPDTRNYEILIGADISGSTSGERSIMIRETILALGEVCRRLGITSSIYTHNTEGREAMCITTIKTPTDAWNQETISLVKGIGHGGTNTDGRNLQFYRKKIEQSKCTDKIILYVTDGAMPGVNEREELPILRSEIDMCKKLGITLMGVGVFTDSPTAHGLQTARVDSAADYPAVIDMLAKRLM